MGKFDNSLIERALVQKEIWRVDSGDEREERIDRCSPLKSIDSMAILLCSNNMECYKEKYFRCIWILWV